MHLTKNKRFPITTSTKQSSLTLQWEIQMPVHFNSTQEENGNVIMVIQWFAWARL